jgi:hypothetical protein
MAAQVGGVYFAAGRLIAPFLAGRFSASLLSHQPQADEA